MTIAESFLADFDPEMSNTRRVLERVPDDKLDFKPHPKSGTMGWLATHVATLPRWVPIVLSTDEFDVMAGGPRPGPASSRDELLQSFADKRAAARDAVAAASDEDFAKPWTFRAGDRVVFSGPRINVLRNFFLHHQIHHRAQLTVYLRLNDVPVPGLYGPTADE